MLSSDSSSESGHRLLAAQQGPDTDPQTAGEGRRGCILPLPKLRGLTRERGPRPPLLCKTEGHSLGHPEHPQSHTSAQHPLTEARAPEGGHDTPGRTGKTQHWARGRRQGRGQRAASRALGPCHRQPCPPSPASSRHLRAEVTLPCGCSPAGRAGGRGQGPRRTFPRGPLVCSVMVPLHSPAPRPGRALALSLQSPPCSHGGRGGRAPRSRTPWPRLTGASAAPGSHFASHVLSFEL